MNLAVNQYNLQQALYKSHYMYRIISHLSQNTDFIYYD
jgi:hypothetical protein